jgi:hypothetical protein
MDYRKLVDQVIEEGGTLEGFIKEYNISLKNREAEREKKKLLNFIYSEITLDGLRLFLEDINILTECSVNIETLDHRFSKYLSKEMNE